MVVVGNKIYISEIFRTLPTIYQKFFILDRVPFSWIYWRLKPWINLNMRLDFKIYISIFVIHQPWSNKYEGCAYLISVFESFFQGGAKVISFLLRAVIPTRVEKGEI